MIDRLVAALADRYTIERELGAGGMATVYLARDRRHEREVAIKVLREDLSASLGAGRFLREVKIAAQLQHPNILPLLDSGEAAGVLYFVMPYIKGQSLRERLARDGELPVHDAVRLLTEVVDALVEAHAHGVVHRDIKPDNVMLSARHALVTDFGVAKAISEATGRNAVTTLGVAVGTPTYMSPEQAAADPHVDHRSDIYSVGVMAYEMLTGRPPFVGNSPQQVLAAHVTEAPDPVSKRRPAIPAELQQVVMRCLAKRPADRFQSAVELYAALEPLATPSTGITPTHTHPTDTTARTARGKLLVAGAIVVVLGATAAALMSRGSTKKTPITFDRVRLTTSGSAFRPAVSPDGKQVSFVEAICLSDSVPCRQRVVVQDIASGARQVVLDSADGAFFRTIWSATGTWLAMAFDTHTDIQSRLGGPAVTVGMAVAFTPRGDTALVLTNRDPTNGLPVYLKRLVAPWTQPLDSVRVTPPDGALNFGRLAISPNGNWIAAMSDARAQTQTMLSVFDRKGTTTSSRLLLDRQTAPIIWNADGTALLRGIRTANQGGLERIAVNPRDGHIGAMDTIIVSPNAERVWSLSADGSVAAYEEAQTGDATVWALEVGAKGGVPRITRRVTSGPAVSDGRISADGATTTYVTMTAAGSAMQGQVWASPFGANAPTAVTPPLGNVTNKAITKDGRRLIVATVSGSNTLHLAAYEIATGRIVKTAAFRDTLEWMTAIGGGGIAVGTQHTLMFLDDSLRMIRRVTVPDSVGVIGFGVGSAREHAVALFVYPRNLSAGADGNFRAPVIVATESGELRTFAVLAIRNFNTMHWLKDGTIWLDGFASPARTFGLYRVTPTGQERIGELPFRGDWDMDLSADGRRGVVTIRSIVADVWLLRNFEPARR
ncbi:MAG: protein kinase [Gemmatimonadaceae bacterium]